MIKKWIVVPAAVVGLLSGCAAGLANETGQLMVVVRDRSQSAPYRIHLLDSAKKTPRVPGWPAWNDHVVCDAGAHLRLPAGHFHYEIERGPEYDSSSGELTVVPDRETTLSVDLRRITDLAAQGWWSGELHVHRPVADVPLLMRAEDLHVAPIISWWNKNNLWAGRAAPARRVVRFDRDRYYD